MFKTSLFILTIALTGLGYILILGIFSEDIFWVNNVVPVIDNCRNQILSFPFLVSPHTAFNVSSINLMHIKSFPEKDKDPIYIPNPPQVWDVKITAESGIWKLK